MTFTETYTSAHLALTQTARENGITPYELRVLVAVCERGHVRSDVLEADMGDHGSGGSGVRRALLTLFALDYVQSPQRRRGTRSLIFPTDEGLEVAGRVLRSPVAEALV